MIMLQLAISNQKYCPGSLFTVALARMQVPSVVVAHQQQQASLLAMSKMDQFHSFTRHPDPYTR